MPMFFVSELVSKCLMLWPHIHFFSQLTLKGPYAIEKNNRELYVQRVHCTGCNLNKNITDSDEQWDAFQHIEKKIKKEYSDNSESIINIVD